MNAQREPSTWLNGPDSPCQIEPRNIRQPRRLVLLGPPGAGKRTQAVMVAAAYGACHLSTGDIFRTVRTHRLSQVNPVMQAALVQMRMGRLVADDTVLAAVRERVQCLSCRGGFVLDGFPRTVVQAEALDALLSAHGIALDAVLDFELPHARIYARLYGRRSCPNCKMVFHLETHPPVLADLCDECGARLVHRDDDLPEVVGIRLAAYEQTAAPLVEYYRARGLLVTVQADGTPAEVFERTMQRLRQAEIMHQV